MLVEVLPEACLSIECLVKFGFFDQMVPYVDVQYVRTGHLNLAHSVSPE